MGTLSWSGLWASGWGVRERLDEIMAEFTGLMSYEHRQFEYPNLYVVMVFSTAQRGRRTSSSPTIIATALPPLGTTCATSLNRTVSLLPLTRFTRNCSMTSGLSRPPPPDRSFWRSSFNRVRASEMPVCSCVKSKGSAPPAPPAPPDVDAAGEESASSLRLFLSFFLLRMAEVVKVCRCSVFGMRGVVDDGVWYWEVV
jgi:hypothetical protein